MKNIGLAGMIVVILACATGCEIVGRPVTPTPSPVPTTPISPVSTPSLTPESTATPTTVPFPGLITLKLWVPDFMPLYNEEGEATYIMEQVEAFSRAHRDLQVDVLVKKATGTGGIYDLMSTASPVAPEVLPDLVVLNTADLQKSAGASLVQPLPASVSVPTTTYPVALEATQPATHSYGVPLLMEVDQTVYNPRLALTAPLSWTAVLSGGYSLLFPASPPDDLADDAVLAAYLGSGGGVVDETGTPFLDRIVLEELYGFLSDLRERNLLNVTLITEFADASACWDAYQQRQATLSVVPAAEYWTAENRIDAPGWMPTAQGAPYSIAHLWSIGLVTSDPIRQEAALALAAWLTEPERSAELAQQTRMLPTNEEALVFWGLMPEELDFLNTLLTDAALPPLPEDIERPVRRALQAGLVMLLEEPAATPKQAAAQALTVLRK